MPELPEVEITARLLDEALRGARIESALAPGINALKTFDPPLTALEGQTIAGVRRRGKNLIVEVGGAPAAEGRYPEDGATGDMALLIHLMSAGRLQLYDKRAGPRDRTSRLLVRVRTPGGEQEGEGSSEGEERELRLRELGSRQAAWVKLLRAGELDRVRGAGQARPRGLAGPAAGRRVGAPAGRAAAAAPAAARSARDRGDRALVGR